MAFTYTVPPWFFGYDVFMEVIFAFITLVVAIYAFKVFTLSNQKQSRLLGTSFVFISAAYFLLSYLNLCILSRLNEELCEVMHAASTPEIKAVGVYVHILLFLVGLVTLAYMTMKANPKAYGMMVLLMLVAMYFTVNAIYTFYVLSSILLAFVVYFYAKLYAQHRQSRILLMTLAFALLLFGKIHFIFSVNHALFYAVGHVFELAAYLLILTNLILVLRR